MVDMLSRFIVGNDMIANKLTGLYHKHINHIINCSDQQGNRFAREMKYVNLSDCAEIDIDTQKQLKEIFEDKKNIVMIHSEDSTKTLKLFCIIAMIVLRIRLKDLFEHFDPSHQNALNIRCTFESQSENFEKMIASHFNQLRDTEIAIFGGSSIQSDHMDKDTKKNMTDKNSIRQTVPTQPTDQAGSKISGAMFDNPMDRADQLDNPIDLDDQSDYTESEVRQPIPQQSIRMYDNDDDQIYDPEKTKQTTYQKVIAVMGDSIDREIVMDMVNRGMTAGKILNILIVS
jgi:hypothetical protein